MHNGLSLPAPPTIVIAPMDGRPDYVCERRAGLLRPSWTILNNGRRCARMSAKLGFAAKWGVESEVGEFELRQSAFNMRNAFTVQGGPYHEARLTGSLLDRTFKLEWQGNTVAQAQADVMSIIDIHEIEVLGVGPDDELITVICMLALRAERMKMEGLE